MYTETLGKNNSTNSAHNISVKKWICISLVILTFFVGFPAGNPAKAFGVESIDIEVKIDERKFSFTDREISRIFGEGRKPKCGGSLNEKQNSAKQLESMGFDRRTIVSYLFPGIEEKLLEIHNEVVLQPQNAVVEFSGINAYVKRGVIGIDFDKEQIFEAVFENLAEGRPIKVEIESIKNSPEIVSDDLLPFINLRGSFVTHIKGANQEGRKHNIHTALMRFYGRRIENGERVSFNSVIGNTTEYNGYALAKIIVNGKYEDGFGGGVCQASTTLYNALLLAGVDVLQARSHSLRIGYVEPSFDAMVSFGVSDLVFQNNTGGPIFITTFAGDSACGAYIYGLHSDITIERRSEILERAEDTPEDINFKSKGFLEYYKNGSLIRTKNIRNDTYYVLKNS